MAIMISPRFVGLGCGVPRCQLWVKVLRTPMSE